MNKQKVINPYEKSNKHIKEIHNKIADCGLKISEIQDQEYNLRTKKDILLKMQRDLYKKIEHMVIIENID